MIESKKLSLMETKNISVPGFSLALASNHLLYVGSSNCVYVIKITVVKSTADKHQQLKFTFDVTRKVDVDIPEVIGFLSETGLTTSTCFGHAKAVLNFDSRSPNSLEFSERIESMVNAAEDGHVLLVKSSNPLLVMKAQLDSQGLIGAKATVVTKMDSHIGLLMTNRPNKHFFVVSNRPNPTLTIVTSLDYAVNFCSAVQHGYRAGENLGTWLS